MSLIKNPLLTLSTWHHPGASYCLITFRRSRPHKDFHSLAFIPLSCGWASYSLIDSALRSHPSKPPTRIQSPLAVLIPSVLEEGFLHPCSHCGMLPSSNLAVSFSANVCGASKGRKGVTLDVWGNCGWGLVSRGNQLPFLMTHSAANEHTSFGPTCAFKGSACSRCPEATAPPKQTLTSWPIGPSKQFGPLCSKLCWGKELCKKMNWAF